MSEKKMIGENQKKNVFKKTPLEGYSSCRFLKFRLAKHKSARFSHSYQEMMAS